MKSKLYQNLPSCIIAIFMVIPILCVLSNALNVNPVVWNRLWTHRIPFLLKNSIFLTCAVIGGTLILGTLLAFLVERTNLPFRNTFRALFITPMIIPCYITAICYINFFGIKGLGEKLFSQFGLTVQIPSIYGFWGAALLLIIGSYPYVYMIVRASLKNVNSTFSEAAQTLGVSKAQRLIQVTLPLLIPAFSAGAVLVGLYVLSDFGVVSLLRYPTFVSTIYEQMSGRYDFSTATALSSVLIVLTIGLFAFQESLQKRRHFTSPQTKPEMYKLIELRLLRIPAFLLAMSVVVIGLVIPLGILLYWFYHSTNVSQEIGLWSMSMRELIYSGLNSLSLSALVATITVILVLPLAYWTVRRPESLAGKLFSWIAQSGVALPGILTALGISILFGRIAPKLNFSILALVCAFLVHFFAQGFQFVRAGLKQIPAQIEEGSRLLGYSPFQTFWKITRPLLKPTLWTAWILIFLSSMRELPASLLLRPAGFDPLTVKVWNAASEGFYEQAAAPALLLILLSLPLTFLASKSTQELSNTGLRE